MSKESKVNTDLLAALRAITGYVATNHRNGLLKYAEPHVHVALAAIDRAQKEQSAGNQSEPTK